MARIKDASVEEIRAAADIVAVVSARTQLRKTGARYMGRCPFHEERTPSFSVNAPDKLYYCFGCGAKGDLIVVTAVEVPAREGRRDHVRARDRAARLCRRDRMARRPFQRPARIRGNVATAGRTAPSPRPAPCAPRRSRELLRALPLGFAGGIGRARLPRGPRARRRDLS